MKCPNCETGMKVTKRDYKYKEAGLNNVLLHNIKIYDCPECGEELPEIPNINALHSGIGSFLIQKQSPLLGEEIRFLRKSMEMRANDFALYLGVTPVTVSRWESNTEPIGPQSDRLVRAMYLFFKERNQDVGPFTVMSKSFETFSNIAKRLIEKEPKEEMISIQSPETLEEQFAY